MTRAKRYCIFCKAEIQPLTYGGGYKVQCPECLASIDFHINIYPIKKENRKMKVCKTCGEKYDKYCNCDWVSIRKKEIEK